jgi:hypothetical protein
MASQNLALSAACYYRTAGHDADDRQVSIIFERRLIKPTFILE